MGLARGRGRGKGRGGILKPKSSGIAVKPPPLLGRPASPPPMALRPRGLPVPPLLPRMRPPPPGLRPSRGIPRAPPSPMLGPGRPVPPPFHSPPPPHGPPLMPLRPPMPPQSLLRPRAPMHGGTYSTPMSSRGKFSGKRGGVGVNIPKGGKGKGKKNEFVEDSEINKPWVTEAMKAEIQKKHRLFQKAKQSNAQSDWDQFKEQRNRVTTMIREAKLEFIGSHPEEGSCAKDSSHYCETCDKGFRSEEALTEHLSQHQTCGLEGCQFTAHAAVVTRHVEMQHATGLYSKIKAITNKPEDIAKWISERKKRYPTKENIEKQKKEREERMKRGERLEDQKTRFNPDFSVRRGRTNESRVQKRSLQIRGKRSASRTDSTVHTKPAKMKYVPRKARPQLAATMSYHSEEEENRNCRGKLPAFLGTVAFSHENEDSEDEKEEEKKFSDDEWDASQENKTEMKDVAGPTATVSTALSNIMGMYASGASDSEGEESQSNEKNTNDQGVEKNAEKTKTPLDIPPESSSKSSDGNKVCKPSVTNDSEDSGPEEVPIAKDLETGQTTEKQPESEEQQQPLVQSSGRKRKRVHRERAGKRKFEGKGGSEQRSDTTEQPQAPRQKMHLRRRRLTLLEKLLSSEIRHERNIILQCVRYVVNENFFDGAADTQNLQNGKCTKVEDEKAEEKRRIFDRILKKLETVRQCNRYVVQKNFFGVPCAAGIECDEDKDN